MLLVLWKKWRHSSSNSARSPDNAEARTPERMVEQIQNGDHELRNELIRQYHPYVLKTTSRFFRRYIDPQQDDAFSVALAAFNEAISGYSPEGGRLFLGFSETVINRRLIDYVRQESRHAAVVPYSAFDTEAEDGGGEINHIEVSQAIEAYNQERTSDERKMEIAALTAEMELYGITFNDLVQHSPRHQDSREALLRMGRRLASEETMFRFLREKRQLPIKELCEAEDISRKTAERHRKYLIAVSLIAYGTYPFLQGYIGLDRYGKGETP
ncbi:RNA polymerase sigma-I factor [Cohnella silvisoli]|uniref:RNA polymerase sigma factor SigI n=1 Tax=Cohnella silvisoli TaxID=2873699 RepID=A0ABV1KXC8_9BACL|nr:RNA polymerase sigma-I factor [Cohnella silvisoli]MCD9024153.1 RNA polymerase sigma-I factor [Cohnella silvisoli]